MQMNVWGQKRWGQTRWMHASSCIHRMKMHARQMKMKMNTCIVMYEDECMKKMNAWRMKIKSKDMTMKMNACIFMDSSAWAGEDGVGPGQRANGDGEEAAAARNKGTAGAGAKGQRGASKAGQWNCRRCRNGWISTERTGTVRWGRAECTGNDQRMCLSGVQATEKKDMHFWNVYWLLQIASWCRHTERETQIGHSLPRLGLELHNSPIISGLRQPIINTPYISNEDFFFHNMQSWFMRHTYMCDLRHDSWDSHICETHIYVWLETHMYVWLKTWLMKHTYMWDWSHDS